MSTPISNNQSSVISNSQTARTEGQEKEAQSKAQHESEASAASTRDDSVNLSRAAELLNQAQTARTENRINSPEQAVALAQQLKAQIESNPAQALQGQSNELSKDLIGLLKTI